jgi:hypothetical protein
MLSILRTPSQLVDCLDSVQDPMQQSVTLKILSLSSCRILASGLLLNLSELAFQVGFDVGNWPFWWLMSKFQDQTSTHQYHVGKRQQTLRWRNLEENGRQNFEDSSSRGVPKQTTPVHEYRILFAFPLAPYQREDLRASGEFLPLPKSQKKIPK